MLLLHHSQYDICTALMCTGSWKGRYRPPSSCSLQPSVAPGRGGVAVNQTQLTAEVLAVKCYPALLSAVICTSGVRQGVAAVLQARLNLGHLEEARARPWSLEGCSF